MSAHTKEPWIAEECRIRSNGNLIASTWLPREIPRERAPGESWLEMMDRTEKDRETINQEAAENARRIVAAVNACAGIETAFLERYSVKEAGGLLRVELIQQRDALRAALELLSGMKLGMVADRIVDKALAQCKGEPT